jgi:hypothetical protein
MADTTRYLHEEMADMYRDLHGELYRRIQEARIDMQATKAVV